MAVMEPDLTPHSAGRRRYTSIPTCVGGRPSPASIIPYPTPASMYVGTEHPPKPLKPCRRPTPISTVAPSSDLLLELPGRRTHSSTATRSSSPLSSSLDCHMTFPSFNLPRPPKPASAPAPATDDGNPSHACIRRPGPTNPTRMVGRNPVVARTGAIELRLPRAANRRVGRPYIQPPPRNSTTIPNLTSHTPPTPAAVRPPWPPPHANSSPTELRRPPAELRRPSAGTTIPLPLRPGNTYLSAPTTESQATTGDWSPHFHRRQNPPPTNSIIGHMAHRIPPLATVGIHHPRPTPSAGIPPTLHPGPTPISL